MARCSNSSCVRWRPDVLARHGHAGVVFDGAWFCSVSCVARHAERVLSDSPPPEQTAAAIATPKLGTILVAHRVVTLDVIEVALREQRQSRRRLGAQLLEMGVVTAEDVLRGLAAQAGVGYLCVLDPGRVARGCATLSKEAIRALGVVPFERKAAEQRLQVACAAPVPRMALAALRQMTGDAVETFLVTDEVFASVTAAYASAAPPAEADDGAGRPDAVRSISDAAARVARAAGRREAARMHHARCDPFMWVRLEGDRGTDDFVLPIDPQQERSCLEAPTLR